MAKTKKVKLTIEDALVPIDKHPFKIPRNWNWVVAKSIFEIVVGATPSTSHKEYYENGDIVWLPSGCCQDCEVNIDDTTYKLITEDGYNSCSTKLMPPDTVMIALTGATAGKVGYLNFEACGNQSIVGLLPNNNISSKFVFYQLLYRRYEILNDCIGSAQPHISKDYVSNMAIALPPFEEQKRIVEQIEYLFTKLDEAKDKAEEVIEGYESRNASIYNDAFSGKLTAKWRKKNNKANSWVTKRFDEVAVIKSNLVDPNDYKDYPHIAPDNIEKRTGILLEYRTIRDDGVTSGKHRFYPGQILYSKIRPYLSKMVMVDFDGLCSADMYPIEAKENSRYLFYYMLSDEFLEQASSAGSRSVLPKINQKELSALNVRITTAEEQEEVVKALDYLLPMMQQARDKAIQVVESIEIMKKSILAKAFRGELGTNSADDKPAIELLMWILDQ